MWKIFGLEAGNYILVAVGRSVAYTSTLMINGSEEIKELDTINVPNYDVSDYREGRGNAVVKLYTVCLKEPITLTFSIAASTVASVSYNSVGSLAIYRFK